MSEHDAPPDERTTIRSDRNFEQTYRLDASEAGEFLTALGEQPKNSDELTLSDDEWELPFAFDEPMELEVDFDGMDDHELEIPGHTDETAPRVE